MVQGLVERCGPRVALLDGNAHVGSVVSQWTGAEGSHSSRITQASVYTRIHVPTVTSIQSTPTLARVRILHSLPRTAVAIAMTASLYHSPFSVVSRTFGLAMNMMP
eukprot:7595983-Pyramimonas_sp.AAC.1